MREYILSAVLVLLAFSCRTGCGQPLGLSRQHCERPCGRLRGRAEVVDGDARGNLGKACGSRSLTAPLPKSDYSGKLLVRVLVEQYQLRKSIGFKRGCCFAFDLSQNGHGRVPCHLVRKHSQEVSGGNWN